MIGAYIRVSTVRQKMDGVSLDTQKDMIIKHAKMIELIKSEKDIKFYIDDGYSAGSLERPAMKKLIADIKENKIRIIFSYDLSRVSRDMFDCNMFLALLQKYDVILKCLYEDVSVETAGDRYSTNIRMAHNQYERERTVEKTNDSLKNIAESGRYPIGGKILYGYKRGDDKQIYIDEITSQYVIHVFEMAKNRCTLIEMKKYINSVQQEKIFQTYQIKKILFDQRYSGILEYKGKVYNNIIPPLIDQNMQDEAKLYYKKKLFKHNTEYLFDEIVFCANCGTKMSCTHGTGKTKRYYYYYCRSCNATIGQVALENYISVLSVNSEEKKEIIQEIDKERYSLNRRIKRLRERYLDKKIKDREFVSLVIPIEDRLEELDLQRKGVKMINRKIQYSDLVSKEDKKLYIQSNFKFIRVDPIKKIVVKIEYNK